MLSLQEENASALQKVSFDVVFLRGDSQENLDLLHRVVKTLAMRLPRNQTQVWTETPEFIRLWNVSSRFLISSYGGRVFVQDECLVFRKQNHADYVFEQHYQVTVVCPKDRVPLVSEMLDKFRRKASKRVMVVVTPLE